MVFRFSRFAVLAIVLGMTAATPVCAVETLVFVRHGEKPANVDNGQLQILTDGRLDESPSFAPNGAQIIYATRDERGRAVLASVSTDGRFKTQIASVAGDVREPVWGPFPRP